MVSHVLVQSAVGHGLRKIVVRAPEDGSVESLLFPLQRQVLEAVGDFGVENRFAGGEMFGLEGTVDEGEADYKGNEIEYDSLRLIEEEDGPTKREKFMMNIRGIGERDACYLQFELIIVTFVVGKLDRHTQAVLLRLGMTTNEKGGILITQSIRTTKRLAGKVIVELEITR